MTARCGESHPRDPARHCLLASPDHALHQDPLGNWPNQPVQAAHEAARPASRPDRRVQAAAVRGARKAAQSRADSGFADPVERPSVVLPRDPMPTQVRAAARVLPRTGTQRRRLYDALLVAGEHGLSDGEMERLLAIKGSSVRPRRGELQSLGLVRDSGRVRPPHPGADDMTVWVAVPLEAT